MDNSMMRAHEVCQALEALYVNPDPVVKQQANKWLTDFQKVNWEPWAVCDKMLQMPQIDMQCHYFAANTLRMKLLKHFDELPAAERIPFRDSLLEHLTRFTDGAQIVRTMLALCVACLAVQMSNEWETSIDDLTNRFGRDPNTALLLLDVMSVFPEEISNKQLIASDSARQAALQHARQASDSIVSILFSYLNSTKDTELQKKVFQCFQGWIKSGMLNSEELVKNPLYTALFEALKISELFNIACEVIGELVHLSEEFHYHHALCQSLITRVLELVSYFEQAQAKGNHQATLKLSILFVQLGESYLMWIVQGVICGDVKACRTMEMLLKVAAYPTKNVASNSFNFWFILSQELTKHPHDSPPLYPREQVDLFCPYFSRLINSLKVVMEYPSNYSQIRPDEKDECKKYRYFAAETLLDASSVLQSGACLSQVFDGLQVTYQKWIESRNQGNGEQWQHLESCLYCIRSIARKVSPNEDKIIQQVMRVIPTVSTNPQLRYTATLIIGRYADWIAMHLEYLQPLLEFVVEGMNLPEIVSSAALTFKHVCEGCSEHLARTHIDGLFTVYEQAFGLSFQDQIEVIEGVCYCVVMLPPNHIQPAIQRMLEPIANDILRGINNKETTELSPSLGRMAEVFRFLSPSCQKPDKVINCDAVMVSAEKVLEHLWSLMEQAMNAFKGDEKRMEKICRCWKYAIKTCKHHFRPLLRPLVALLLANFQEFPHSSFIYTASICVEQFGDDSELLPVMEELFRQFSQRTFQILANLDGFTQCPDVAEDFFDLISRFLRRCPSVVFRHPLLPHVFQCGLGGIGVQHKEACVALMQFFGLLITEGIDNPKVNKKRPGMRGPLKEYVEPLMGVLHDFGPKLAHGLMYNIAGAVPKNHIRYVITVLESLVALNKTQTYKWVTDSLLRLPETTNPDKRTFLMAFSQAQDIRAIRECLTAWARACHRENVLH